MTLFQRQ